MRLILVLTLSFLFFNLNAQDEYIIKDGRKISTVDVLLRFGHKAYTTCTIDEYTELKDFTASDIEEYKIKGKNKFISKDVLGRREFLEEVYLSPLTLYRYIDSAEYTSFFLESEKNGLEHMKEGTYHDVLLDHWPSCIDSTILNNITYDWQSLIGAIDMANTCEEVYVPIPRSFVYGILSSEKPIGLISQNAPSLFAPFYYLTNDWKKTHPAFGFGYQWKQPIAANYIGLNYGATASYRSYGGLVIEPIPNDQIQELKYSAQLFNIALPVTFEVSRKLKNTIGFLEMGLKPSYNVINVGEEIRITSGQIGTFKEENEVKIEDNLQVGILVGTGIEFPIAGKQLMLSLQAQLRLGTTNTRVYNKQAFTLNIGYQISSESVKVKKKRKASKRKIKAEKRRKKMAEKREKQKAKREKDKLKKAEKRAKDKAKKEKKKAEKKAKREKERQKRKKN